MSDALKDFLGGRKIITDTKIRQLKNKDVKPSKLGTPIDNDPHKVFTKRTIAEKPKKSDIIDEFKKFIKSAEEKL